ncbi:MAG: hypothetical protein HYS51_00665 [Candidatus Zambryskibacteria bacterium]|nr:hypothetical protein [Candidatus Zambryskibacteria bacterium]
MKFLFLLLFFILTFFPSALAAETKDNVLEAMCKQVLSGDLDLSPKVLLEKAKEKAVALPGEMLAAATKKLSEVPEVLAEKIESLKKPVPSANSLLLKSLSPETNNSALMASVLNSGIDLASILVRYWQWTSAGIVLLYLLLKFY